jgi:hypothetical protein
MSVYYKKETTMHPARLMAAFGALLMALLGDRAVGQRAIEIDTRDEGFDSVMGFEAASGDALPAPWSTSASDGPSVAAGVFTLDRQIFHSGRSAARLGPSEGGFTELILRIPIDFIGTNVELRGYLRTESPVTRSTPFLRSDSSLVTALRNPIETGPEWVEFSVSGPLDPSAHALAISTVQFADTDTVWLDDLEILVDGVPIREVPRVAREPTDREITDLIARAENAGFRSITGDATIKTVYGPDIKTLRTGSNGWTCWAETLGLGPMCNDAGWDAWLLAYWNGRASFAVDRLSVSYMLAGDGEPPHVMILVPNSETLEGLSTSSRDPVWAMWKGSPYAHIMLNAGDLDQETPLLPTALPASLSQTQRTIIEMPPSMLERYTGRFALRGTHPWFYGNVIELASDGEGLFVQVEGLPPAPIFNQAFLPVSNKLFASGPREIAFELDEADSASKFSISLPFFDNVPAEFERVD